MYRQANLRHYPTSLLRDAARSKEAPMDLDPKPAASRIGEPPRKRTHYESEEMEIDEYVPPVSAPKIIPTAANKAPFMFHAPSIFAQSPSNTTMHIDEPAPVPSTSANALQEKQSQETDMSAQRDIANGAVQRERKRRNKLKEWQVVKSLPETDDDEDDNNDETMNNDDSPGFTAAARSLLRRNRSKRGNQPVHFSLHHHNYHYPPGNDPFVFNGASSSSSPSSLSLSSSSHSSQAPSSTWWKEEGPYILLGYLQFTFNASLVCIALYLLSSFVLMLSNDISDRTTEYTVEIQQEIMHCSEAYMANRCNPAERVPAMDRQCRDWEFCMNRNPKVVNKARVGAETLAEVVNSFFEVISWRTMLFLLAILTVIISFTNRTISDYRKSHTKFLEVHQAQLQAQSMNTQRPGLTSANTAPGRISDAKE